MLSALRSAAGTWVAKLLLLLLVVSFAVWGISGSLVTGFGGNSVVTAGGTTVSPIEYRLAYDRQISVMSQQFGTRLTREQAKALGVEEQVLAQLVAGAVLDEQASELGLGLSADKLAQLTMSDPAFQGVNGQFDRQQFEYVLRQIGMRPEEYLENRGQVAIRQQIVEAVSDGLKAPDTFLRAVALYRGEDRTAEYIVLPKTLAEPIEEPADAALSEYFESEQAELRRARIPQDRLHRTGAGKHRRRIDDQRRAGEGGLRQEHRPLHDARNAHHRAASIPEPGCRADGAGFDQGRRDLRIRS